MSDRWSLNAVIALKKMNLTTHELITLAREVKNGVLKKSGRERRDV